MSSIIVPIKGMHCKSCKMLIEQGISNVNGVQKVEANSNKGEAKISYEGDHLDMEKIYKEIQKLGYQVAKQDKFSWFSNNKSDYVTLVISILGIYILYLIFSSLGISIADLTTTDNSSLSVVFLVGLTAGISSCMAIVGGLILAVSSSWNQDNLNLTLTKKMIPQLYFNLGRLAGFFVLGGVLGLIGTLFKFSSTALSLVTIAVGLVMLLLGLRLTNISPKISHFTLSLPKLFDHHKPKGHKFNHMFSALTTGALTFFLPCGFTFAMQMFAMSSGSFWTGGLIMLVFALGTLPGLLGVGSIPAFVKGKLAGYFFRFVGVLVLILGIYNISNALNIAKTIFVGGGNPIVDQNAETIHMTYDYNGLSPKTLNLDKGKKYKIVIESKISVPGCMSTILLPGLDDNTQFVRKNSKIIFNVDAKIVGSYDFVCAMGLSHGASIIII